MYGSSRWTLLSIFFNLQDTVTRKPCFLWYFFQYCDVDLPSVCFSVHSSFTLYTPDLMQPEGLYRIHTIPRLSPIMSQLSLVLTLTTCFSKIHFNITLPFMLKSPNWFLVFTTCYGHSVCTQLTFLDLITATVRENCFITQFSSIPRYSICLRSTIVLSTKQDYTKWKIAAKINSIRKDSEQCYTEFSMKK
jgi:hypothetical protein